jgi:hypothetical protein
MLKNGNVIMTMESPTKCKTCGSQQTRRGPGAGPHSGRLMCGGCGRFLKWLGKADVTHGDEQVAVLAGK